MEVVDLHLATELTLRCNYSTRSCGYELSSVAQKDAIDKMIIGGKVNERVRVQRTE